MTAHLRPLPPEIASRLGAVVSRLASTHDGEILASVAAIGRLLKTAQLDFNDMARLIEGLAPTPTQQIIETCLDSLDLFNDRETRFLESVRALVAAGHDLTPKQMVWLYDLHRIAVTQWDREESAA